MPLHNKTRKALLGLLLLAAAYLAFVSYIFLHRHLRILGGDYPHVLTGTYEVINNTNHQIPGVFRGKTLTLEHTKGGSYSVVDEKGNVLSLKQGAEGLFFSENFRPAGAWILPGVARNWNEGRIIARDDILIVEGHLLEMGLMLFVLPFKDVSDWRVELKKAPNNAMRLRDEPSRFQTLESLAIAQ